MPPPSMEGGVWGVCVCVLTAPSLATVSDVLLGSVLASLPPPTCDFALVLLQYFSPQKENLSPELQSPVCLRRLSLTSFMADEEEDCGFMDILDEEELKVGEVHCG